jgi:hypothetical protein
MVNIFLTYIVPSSVFFPIILFLLNKHTATPALKALFVYLLVAAAVNITATILSTLHQHNLWLLHLYTVLETVLLLYFFILLADSKRAKTVLWFLLFAFPLACFFNWLFVQDSNYFNTYTRSVEALIIICASAWYWLSSSSKTLSVAWTSNPLNWIISGLLLYFASALFLFLFSNFLLNNPNRTVRDFVWVSHGFLVIIMYVMFGIGFIKSKYDR